MNNGAVEHTHFEFSCFLGHELDVEQDDLGSSHGPIGHTCSTQMYTDCQTLPLLLCVAIHMPPF
jgi:hypothetical protein